ncbi:MAG: hypothetical protein HDT39_01240 [Lachnospiraceae bacterium]|nr:hypothetical protein [Lachnospiraceae bacterium]
MKKGRIASWAAKGLITLLAVSSITITAFGSKSKDFYYSNVNAYVHGYVDFAKYLGGAQTKVWCNVSLGGADRSCVSAKYTLATDKKKIADNKALNYKKLSASYTAKSGGVLASWAKLHIKYDGKKATLKTQ